MPLVFPGSSRKKKDEPLDPFELVFRDGKRVVVPYMADLMSNLDTVRYTYADAVEQVNNRLAKDFANTAFDGIVRTHMAGDQ
jgi:hypothetical protein